MPDTARNVLFLVADQWRHDRSGFGGTPSVPTPHCDALAAAGRLRTHSFCAYPVCTPSRYSMMNGLYARQHLGLGNTATPRTDVETWPKVLRSAGFDTRAVGKMHSTPTRLDLGFERMILAEQHGDGRFEDDYHGELLGRGIVDRLDLIDQREEYRAGADAAYHASFGAAASALPEGLHSTDWIGDRAEQEIAGWDADARHALLVSFIKPHHPFDPPQAWLDPCDPAATAIPADWTDEPDPRDLALHGGHFPHEDLTRDKLREVARHYDATIRHLDDRIGRILSKLREVGREEDTLVVLTSDHGEYLGSHHLLLKQNTMYEALRGCRWSSADRAWSRASTPGSARCWTSRRRCSGRRASTRRWGWTTRSISASRAAGRRSSASSAGR